MYVKKCVFSVVVNGLPKRMLVDVATSSRVLELREMWCTLLGVILVRRALPATLNYRSLATMIESKTRNFHLEKMRQDFRLSLTELVLEIEAKEYAASASAESVTRNHLLAATPPMPLVAPPVDGIDYASLSMVMGLEPAAASNNAEGGAAAATQLKHSDPTVSAAPFTPDTTVAASANGGGSSVVAHNSSNTPKEQHAAAAPPQQKSHAEVSGRMEEIDSGDGEEIIESDNVHMIIDDIEEEDAPAPCIIESDED